jgi:hypothetical protein
MKLAFLRRPQGIGATLRYAGLSRAVRVAGQDANQGGLMTGTTVGIVVICVVIVAALAIWLGSVAFAARRPGQEHPKRDPLRGVVQGGQHVGGGRSVAPTRDAPVPEGGGNPPSVEEEDAAAQARSQPTRRPGNSGSPMDL